MKKIKNKNITINDRVRFAKNNHYQTIHSFKKLKLLRDNLKKSLFLMKGKIVNKSTNLTVSLTTKSINKIIYPSPKTNIFDSHYIDNLNASFCLKELFENVVYIDTLKPMKSKKDNINEQGYHHFVAPLKMKG